MDAVILRRENTSWSIRQNPSEILITRTERTETEGGFEESTSTAGPFTVRIFKKGLGQQPKEASSLGGTGTADSGWGLIADWRADIRAGTHVKDTFEVPGLGAFAVVSVTPQRLAGQVVAYQADLELMS
ncbi:MAG: hypothetical protein K6T29_09755 [Peptococcaceae bacterium]|nr:hypothetical protein [Peptococcaceae bacterium]